MKFEYELYTASLIPSHPRRAFGHPFSRGEGTGVRGQPQRSDAHANLLISPCLAAIKSGVALRAPGVSNL
jgi:hypothetical protein